MAFTEGFRGYVYPGATIACEVGAFTATATLYHDSGHGTPWEEGGDHGAVSEWTTRDKRPGERVLCRDGHHRRYYDFAGAVRTARADGWDAPPYGEGTPGQRAARAAEADFKRLKAWVNDEWIYLGVAVTVEVDGVALVGKYDHSLWGIESDSGPEYFTEVADELLDDAMKDARARAAELAHTLAEAA